MKLRALLLSGILAWSSTVWAQPQLKGDERIAYLSGGVGELERERLNEMADRFNLKLVFASKELGAYLADVKVSIRGAQSEELVNAVSDGPWFFAKLPPGKYQVVATHSGQPISKTVNVPQTGRSELNFLWSAPESRAPEPSSR
jgi:hypothetical protein